MQLFRSVLVLILAPCILAAACSPDRPAESPAAPVAVTAAASAAVPAATQAASPAALRLAVLPVLDALPMYVAQSEGLFAEQGVTVEFIPVASAPERDQLIVAGQADGMINEALSTAFYNRDTLQVQTVRYARAATAQAPLFSIVAAGRQNITGVFDLPYVQIGISEGTIIHYLTERLLQAEGIPVADIQTVSVPKIPDRVNLLGSGELKAAMLPEPATSLALQQGGILILDDSRHPELSFSTITFRKAVLDEQPQAVRGFLAAVEAATQHINADPQKYVGVLMEMKVLPPALETTFVVPPFVTAGVPTEAQWQDVIAWAKEKGLLDKDVSYTDSVNPGFLP